MQCIRVQAGAQEVDGPLDCQLTQGAAGRKWPEDPPQKLSFETVCAVAPFRMLSLMAMARTAPRSR
eukprot:3622850-Alexandrium_andersonii.AAC.1